MDTQRSPHPTESKRRLSGVTRVPIALPIFFILLTGLAVAFAPRFLAYADKPVQSDAVILFVGNDTVRRKEANRLLDEGYARYLIIPAFRQVLTSKNGSPGSFDASRSPNVSQFNAYPLLYENTHVEVLHAQQMMEAMGLKSAIMVSSPYHMRRIRMISKKVFGEQSRHFSYVPTRYENNPTALFDLTRMNWIHVFREYAKICWFQAYSLFGDTRRSTPGLSYAQDSPKPNHEHLF
jgi:hypothetical protein